MAELVGLLGSIVSLAGAAATVSLTLFECGRNVANARTELDSLATDVSDLSTVLDYLGEVLKKYEDYVVGKTIRTVDSLITRCDKVLQELKVAAELVKSKTARLKWLFRKPKTLEHKLNLEGFKSNLSLVIQTLTLAKAMEQESKKVAEVRSRTVSNITQRNINLLRSTILTNRGVLERIKAAREEGADSNTVQLSPDEELAKSQIQQAISDGAVDGGENPVKRRDEGKISTKDTHSDGSTLIRAEDNLTWEKVLLRSYAKLSNQLPASQTLTSSIPDEVRIVRAIERERRATQRNDDSGGDRTKATDEEAKILLKEWTTTSGKEIDICLDIQRQQVRSAVPNIPSWVQDDYSFVGYDSANPSHWKPKDTTVTDDDAQILPYARFAYDHSNDQQVTLCNLLAEEGGSWVWRHDNGRQRDYFVGNKKVVQYFVHPFDEQAQGKRLPDRTIVGKQWVSKDVLEKAKLEFQEYGEGSYSINGKLNAQEVRQLHEAASVRTEELLRRLAAKTATPQSTFQETPTTALALFNFTSVEQGDLSFKKGDVLNILGEPADGESWWKASLAGKTGLIPSNYVRIVKDDEASESGSSHAANNTETTEATDGERVKTSRLRRWKGRFDQMRREASEVFAQSYREAQQEAERERQQRQ